VNDPHTEIMGLETKIEDLEAEVKRLNANLAAIRCEIDARRECADVKAIRAYADKDADMRPETLMAQDSTARLDAAIAEARRGLRGA
jgi:hypothetical protein